MADHRSLGGGGQVCPDYMAYYDDVKEAADAVRSRIPQAPEIAVVLGSGLGDFANSATTAIDSTQPNKDKRCAFMDLPHER